METIERMIDDAYGHLKAARNQMIASDDRIICDHVRDALVSLEIARRELKGIQELEAQMLKALKDVYEDWGNAGLSEECYQDVGKAIAKAEGGTQSD